MKFASLTIEQQRDYVRRLEEGWKAASADQAATARGRTEAEKWAVADQLQQMADSYTQRNEPPAGDASKNGLVEQQRLFMQCYLRP